MFEAKTYEALMEEVLAAAPPGIDTRKGSIFFDSTSAIVNLIAKYYTDLESVLRITFIYSASDDYLDLRASEYGIQRRAATPARYFFEYTGTRPPVGWRFFHNDSGHYFLLGETEEGQLYLEAEEPGIKCNYIQNGDIAVPVDTVVGMTSANFGEVYEYGTDAESDDSLRERTLEYISGPARNGNRQHYKTWCESVDGVGRARIEPLWNGENTVRAVLISPLGLPVPESVREEVQQYIDPDGLGMTAEIDGKSYVVGDGLGNGKANIGAHFTAVAAEAVEVELAFKAELRKGRTEEEVQEAVEEAVTRYLQKLVMETEDGETIIVRLSAVGGILSDLTRQLVDYSELTMNGKAENIVLRNTEVPVLGEVMVDVLH